MTEPTDDELDAVLCSQWPAFSMQATLVRMWVRAAMRDAIAKWGTPAPVGVEPLIPFRHGCKWCGKTTGCKHTPQPTQPQAGAVPLTQYRVLEPRVDRIEAGDEFLQNDAQTWAIDPNGTFVGTIYGYALRAARRRIAKKEGADHG